MARLAKHFVVMALVAYCAAGGAAFQMVGLPGDSTPQRAVTHQQPPDARGTYRVQVHLVPVDVIVTDANHRKVIHDKVESWLELHMTGLAAIYGSKEIPPAFQAEIDKIFAAPNSISHRLPSAPLGDAASMNKDASKVMEQALIPAWSPSRNEFTQLESDAITDLPFEEYAATFAATYQDMQNIYTCIRYMRLMEGEKHLLFFTQDGLFLSRLEYENGLAAIANDARVMIHTLQTGGLPLLPSFSRTFAISSLRNVSQLTGGRAAVREDIGKALARVNESTRAEYLLGYYPQDENWNGTYRKIDVKVSRPGVKVSFRHGYYARKTLPPYNREEFIALDRIRAAANYAPDLSDIGFSIATSPGLDPLGPPEIKIDFQVEPGKVGLRIVNGFYTGKLYSAVFCADAMGKYLGETRGTVEINFPQAQYPLLTSRQYRLDATQGSGEDTYRVLTEFVVPDDEAYYGLGQHGNGRMDQRGQSVPLWHDGQPGEIGFCRPDTRLLVVCFTCFLGKETHFRCRSRFLPRMCTFRTLPISTFTSRWAAIKDCARRCVSTPPRR